MLEENKLAYEVKLYKRDEYYNDDTNFMEESMAKNMVICIKLKGTSNCEDLLENLYCEKINQGNTLLDIVNQTKMITSTQKNTHKQFVGLTIPKNFLEQNLPNNKIKDELLNFFENDMSIKNISNKKTNPRTKSLALDIFNNPYKDNLEKLYTESKALELIYTEFTNLFQQNELEKNKSMKFTKQDKEAIYHARDILINNLQNPPSMKELARLIAVNDLKLKVGFHKYFNDTPYNIYNEYRLQEAKRLLNKSDLNINEISAQIGYKYTQSFSNAFFKRFGVRPKELMKSRKYYY